jgi:hypothetical protein
MPASTTEKLKPAFKLQSDIEHETDIGRVVDEHILSQTIQMPLRTFLGVSRKELEDDFTNRVRRRRQPLEDSGSPSGTKVMAAALFPVGERSEELPKGHYSRLHWARATTEVPVRLGDLREPIVTLIDHSSEVNLMSSEVFSRSNWPVTTEHGGGFGRQQEDQRN